MVLDKKGGVMNRDLSWKKLGLWIALMAFPVFVISFGRVHAHGGRLDSSGCHHDRKVGENQHHCHRRNPTDSVRYNREDYLPRWADADGDCQNTRQEVLIAESRVPVTLGPRRCRVITGQWHDPYTGRIFTNPRRLDIDHVVPLREAHDSGAASWSRSRKRSFANDLSNANSLIAVYRGENRSKGARDPASWLPRNQAYHCDYVRVWRQVKNRWGLSMDSAEIEAIKEVLSNC